MHSWVDHWPIVDPTIPPHDKRRILGNQELLKASAASRQRYGPSQGSSGWPIVIAVIVCTAIVVQIGTAVAKGSTVALVIILLFSTVIAAFFVWLHHESASRLSRTYRDRYVLPSDLDNEAHALFQRATNATMTVSRSQTGQRGFLDSVANDVLFPQQLWEIGRLLRSQSALRAEQAAAARGVVVTPELRAVLAPQQQALQHSVAMVAQRVVELEDYARRVQKADAALRAHEQLQNNDKYRYLLAHTDDRMGMQSLMEQAVAAESTLTRSVQDAIAAGQTLVVRAPGH